MPIRQRCSQQLESVIQQLPRQATGRAQNTVPAGTSDSRDIVEFYSELNTPCAWFFQCYRLKQSTGSLKALFEGLFLFRSRMMLRPEVY